MGGQDDHSHLENPLPQSLFCDREEALSMLQATFESTADGLLVVSRDGRILGYNQKFLHMWNIDPALVAPDSNPVERFQYLADQTTDPEGFKARVLELFDRAPEAVVFDQLTLKDGRIFERYSQPQQLNGKIVGRVWSYRDITERHRAELAVRQSEEKFRRIVEHANDVILLVGPQGNVLYASPNISSCSGFSAQEVEGQSFYTLVHPDDRPMWEHNFLQVLTSRQDKDEIEFRSRHKTDIWVWKSASLALSHEESGYPVVVVVTRPINERKQREKALKLLVEGTASQIGEAFFQTCIRHMVNLLRVDAVLIGKLNTPEKSQVSTLSFYLDDQLRENFQYDLAGTPCEHLIRQKKVFSAENIIATYPEDELVAAEGLDNYLGVPLTSSTHEVIGLVALLNREKLDFDPDRELFLRIFAARISAELERQQAEEALRQSEVKYRTIFENSQVGMGRTRLADGLILEANQRFADIMGYPSPADMINRVSTQPLYANPDDRLRILQQLHQRDGIHNFELQLIRQDGQSIWTLLSLQLNLKDGCIDFVITDISERKQAEAALQQREADYRQLVKDLRQSQKVLHTFVDNLPLTVFSKNVQNDFRYELINQNAEKVMGFSAEMGLGKNDHELLSAEMADLHRQEDLEVLRQGKPLEISRELFRSDIGENLFIRSIKVPLYDSQGKPSHILAIGEDFTARKRAELLLSAQTRVLESIASGVPLEDTLTLLIETFESLGHCQCGSILFLDEQGKRLHSGIGPHLPEGYRQALDGLEIGPSAASCGTAAYRKAPVIVVDTLTDPLWAEARPLAQRFNIRSCWSMPIKGTFGKVLGTFAMAFDHPKSPSNNDWQVLGTAAHLAGIAIERQRTATELFQAKEAAETASRAKSQFLANMSHELRTPLNAILGFTQLMSRDSNLSSQQQHSLKVINTSGNHLLALINDVLEMSKIEAGTVSLSTAPFDLSQLLDSVQGMFQIQAMEKGLLLQFLVDTSVPRYGVGDEGKLRQVLINLLGNAIKFTNQGQISLTVQPYSASQNTEEGAGMLQFAIADTGPGIPDEVIPLLFQPFVQALHHVPGEGGSGLGLAITRQFVEMMGGTIDVDTTLGEGTIFTFRIPFEVPDAVAIDPKTSPPTVQYLAPNQPQYRILVVDDRPENRIPLSQLLQSVGFQVREAQNGQAALDLWQTWHPHLIWMDMRMPVLDGYEATQRIREKEQEIRAASQRASEPASKPQSDGVPGTRYQVSGTQNQLAPSTQNPEPETHPHISPSAHPPIPPPPPLPTKIIALTAHAFEDHRATVLAAGCDDFLAKPFSAEDIFRKMTDHLGVSFELTEPGNEPSANTLEFSGPLQGILQQMPEDWLSSFHQAAIEADADWLRALIAQVPESQASIKPYLSSLVNQLDFETLISITEILLDS
jgi:two-component system sensor histidine kinase/response regulator